MEYKTNKYEYTESHMDHGPLFEDSAGNMVLEHTYIPHNKRGLPVPPPPQEPQQSIVNAINFEDVPGEVAHLMMLVALFIYGYTLVGCYIFEPCFVRKLAYGLQSIRLVMLFSSLLPCVVHWQAFQIFPNITAREFPYVVVALLMANVAISKGAEHLLDKFMEKYQNSEGDDRELLDRPHASASDCTPRKSKKPKTKPASSLRKTRDSDCTF